MEISHGFNIIFTKIVFYVLISVVIFPIFNWGRSFSPCRLDKCVFGGGLFTSYFPHENFLGMFVACTLPLYIFLEKKSHRLLFLSLNIAIIALTGARIAFAMLALFLVMRFLNSRVLSFFPLCMAIINLIIFILIQNPLFLTGRGEIYAAIRASLSGHWFFGAGFLNFTNIYMNQGGINFQIYHEHGFSSSYLSRFGYLGLLAMILFCSLVIIYRSRIPLVNLQILAILSLTFLSETSAQNTFYNPFSWILVFVYSSISHSHKDELDLTRSI